LWWATSSAESRWWTVHSDAAAATHLVHLLLLLVMSMEASSAGSSQASQLLCQGSALTLKDVISYSVASLYLLGNKIIFDSFLHYFCN
jgi:hypothetical protein